jgi:hypothetical protein
MTAKRELCEDLIEEIENYPFDIFNSIRFNKTEADFLLILLRKWLSESDRHQKRYAENTEYYKKVNSERYYANKAKINTKRKQKYKVRNVEVFKK